MVKVRKKRRSEETGEKLFLCAHRGLKYMGSIPVADVLRWCGRYLKRQKMECNIGCLLLCHKHIVLCFTFDIIRLLGASLVSALFVISWGMGSEIWPAKKIPTAKANRSLKHIRVKNSSDFFFSFFPSLSSFPLLFPHPHSLHHKICFDRLLCVHYTDLLLWIRDTPSLLVRR